MIPGNPQPKQGEGWVVRVAHREKNRPGSEVKQRPLLKPFCFSWLRDGSKMGDAPESFCFRQAI